MMHKVTGFGSPLVDILTETDDDFLKANGLVKGGMTLVDRDLSDALIRGLKDGKMSPGGSAMNCIKALARLGVTTAFAGTTADDELGKVIKNALAQYGIQSHLTEVDDGNGTGRVVSLISPGGERTFATHLGAASSFNTSHLKPELFQEKNWAFIEGYLVYNHELILAACARAKAAGMKVALDLASFNVVQDFKSIFKELLEQYTDLVFANEEEAKAMTGLEPEEALQKLSESCEIAVVKIGKQGSLIRSQGKTFRVPAKVIPAIDTTGAGDFYAAGFLAGLVAGKNLETCGHMGAITSREVVRVIGTELTAENWELIRKEISEI